MYVPGGREFWDIRIPKWSRRYRKCVRKGWPSERPQPGKWSWRSSFAPASRMWRWCGWSAPAQRRWWARCAWREDSRAGKRSLNFPAIITVIRTGCWWRRVPDLWRTRCRTAPVCLQDMRRALWQRCIMTRSRWDGWWKKTAGR